MHLKLTELEQVVLAQNLILSHIDERLSALEQRHDPHESYGPLPKVTILEQHKKILAAQAWAIREKNRLINPRD